MASEKAATYSAGILYDRILIICFQTNKSNCFLRFLNMTEYEKCLAGMPFNGGERPMTDMASAARRLMRAFDAVGSPCRVIRTL